MYSQSAAGFDLLHEAKLFSTKNNEKHGSFNVLITPSLAETIIRKHNYANQRPLSKSHVGVLAEAMKNSDFREYTSIGFAVRNGEPILVNGQHTLNAIALSGKSIWLSFHFDRVQDDAEVEALYSTFDIGRKRQARDTMGSIGEELGLHKKERDSLSSAVTFVNLGFRPISGKDSPARLYAARDFEFKKNLMREWGDEARLYFECITDAPKFNKEPLFRAFVVAVGLLTIREQPDNAIEFWRGVALDDGLRIGDPRKALVNWLKTNPAGKSPHLQHRAAIACWNAWFDGRQLTKVYPRSSVSLEIHGTPIVIAGDGRSSLSE